MKLSLLLGRILFGGYFVLAGLNHFINIGKLAPYAASHGVPLPDLAVSVTGGMLVLGGLSVLLGFMPRVGLTLILLFLVPVTLIMHNFWALSDPQARMVEITSFLKNTGLIGATLAMVALPLPWPNSVAGKQPRSEPRTDWLTGRRISH